jgi:hypothetical protein
MRNTEIKAAAAQADWLLLDFYAHGKIRLPASHAFWSRGA